ncbi:MAG: ParA family protein, partial [Lawsonibacter sp.]
MRLSAVWGSSGGGKSTVALALGAAFARRKEDCLILSTDSGCPSLPLYLPRTTELNGNHSIGSLLEQKTMSEGSLKNRIHRHPKS